MKKWIITGGLVLASPWWWFFLKYPDAFMLRPSEFFGYRDQNFIQTVNTYQGWSGNKLAANKYTWTVKEWFDRAIETGNMEMLFFTGDLDSRRSTQTFGPLLISWIIASVIGIKNSSKKKIWIGVIATIACSVLSGLVPAHLYTPARIPVFIMFAYFTGQGVFHISKKWQSKYQLIYGVWIVFDMTRFAHELVLHYLPTAPV